MAQERDARTVDTSDQTHRRTEANLNAVPPAAAEARSLPSIGQDVVNENHALILYSRGGATAFGTSQETNSDRLKRIPFGSAAFMNIGGSPVQPELPLLLPSVTDGGAPSLAADLVGPWLAQ